METGGPSHRAGGYTARHGRSAGSTRALVVTGDNLNDFTKEHWDLALQYKEMVFARTSPKQKLEIVNAHQALGLVVGVTGDGVNDAPAMNQADIGIAMGSGSEVSKETANLVLADDNFANVVVGISLGRLAFENLKKVLLYLLPAGTFCEMLTVLANVFLGAPPALGGILMIVISCGTDMISSLALVFEKPEKFFYFLKI